MIIQLLHNHYDKEKLERVKEEMKELGTPTIRVVWNETQGHYQALEGCHRLRACEILGIIPELKICEEEETVIIELDGYDEEVVVGEILEEMRFEDIYAVIYKE